MSDLLEQLQAWATPERVFALLRAIVTLFVGLLMARIVSRTLGRLVRGRSDPQRAQLAQRFSFYALVMLVLATALSQLGFRLSVLLGAAGVFTVAVGFASQTSASNLISGLFLIFERPFVVGDVILLQDGTIGEVLSVDLMSVKVRTFDNLYVRVPNETVVKSRITNLTYFPLRRVDLRLSVAYKEDLARVEGLLRATADANPRSLDEPKPLFLFQGFGESGIDLQFSVWARRESYLELKNQIAMEIKSALDREGIEIPFPHRSLYAGSATTPLPIRVVHGGEGMATETRTNS